MFTAFKMGSAWGALLCQTLFDVADMKNAVVRSKVSTARAAR